MTKWSQENYQKALRFAAMAHEDQKVPGTAIPYIYHVTLVTMEIIASCDGDTMDQDLAVQCALLHDTIEDTGVRYEDIIKTFGKPVANGVQALTKNKELAKDLRMKDSITRILRCPREVQMVKMADRITNLAKPPEFWTREKIASYRDEAVYIFESLRSSSNLLAERLMNKIHEYNQYMQDSPG